MPQPATPPVGEQGGATWRGTERYAVVRCIGRGGMGVVYEVLDRERRQAVALKTLPSFTADALYRFKQEFRALADMHHTNLVRLHELVASETGEVFFTMELVHGTDFAQYVQDAAARRSLTPPSAVLTLPTTPRTRERATFAPETPARPTPVPAASPVNPHRLRSTLRQLVQGVIAIHTAGKLHRDLKPSNVLVTPGGRLVILDFGVAADLPPAVRPIAPSDSEIVGTAIYMAPEHVSGDAAPDPASDWYSVGVMLYEALVGRPPFAGSVDDVLTLKTRMDPAAPSECVDGVAPELDALCMALLQRDPAKRPDGEAILRSLGVWHSSAPPASPHGADGGGILVGREAPLRALREAAGATRAGRSITMRVGGASGMGKSATVHHFLDELAADGATVVLRGRAYEREAIPYKAVDSVVDALSRYLMDQEDRGEPVPLPEDTWALGRLFPVLQRVEGVATLPREEPDEDAQALRRRAFGALRELLAAIAERRGLVVFVDDAQWGDLDSAALLLEVLRPPDAPPLLLLMTYRDGEDGGGPLLDEMRDRWPEGAEARELTIGPLDFEDAQQLALALLDASDEAAHRLARAVASEAHGSPFLVEELVRSNLGQVRADTPALAVLTLDEVVAHRLALLPEAARRVVEILAVGARPLLVSVVANASGVEGTIDDVVTLLGTSRLARTGLRDGRDVVEMTHDRIRQTVVASLPDAVVRDHHGRLATALEATPGADLEAIALHLVGAGETGRASSYAERAAEQAASKVAFDQAARMFRLALDTIDPSRPDAQRLRVRLAQTLESAGRSSEAADEYARAARGAMAIERIELERSAAEQLVFSGRIDEGGAALRRVLAVMGMSAPRSALGAVLLLLFYQAWQRLAWTRFRERAPGEVSREDRVRVDTLRAVSMGLGTVDVILGACMQARHLRLAMRVGDRLQVLRAVALELVQLAAANHSGGRHERRMLEMAQRLASRTAEEGRLYLDGGRGVALYMRGRYREALEVLDAVDADSRKTGLRSPATNVRLFAVYACFFTGKLREEARRARPLLREAEDRGDVYTAVSLHSTMMVDMCLAADDPDGALRHLREAVARWTQSGFHVQHWYAMWSEASIELYVGDGARALARIERDARALRKSFLLHSNHVRGFTMFIRGCCAIASIGASPGLMPARVKEARRLARRLDREPAAWSATLGCLLRACAANAAGERTEAVDALRAALRHAEAAGMMLHAWAARRQLGSLLGGEEGARLVAQAEQAMGAEGVRAPARMAGMFLPGRWGEDTRGKT